MPGETLGLSADKAVDRCTDSAGATTLSIRECQSVVIGSLEAELEAQTFVTRQKLTGYETAPTAFEESIAAWEAFEEANCAFHASTWEGGSGAPAVQAGCSMETIDDRIEELRNVMEGGGDNARMRLTKHRTGVPGVLESRHGRAASGSIVLDFGGLAEHEVTQQSVELRFGISPDEYEGPVRGTGSFALEGTRGDGVELSLRWEYTLSGIYEPGFEDEPGLLYGVGVGTVDVTGSENYENLTNGLTGGEGQKDLAFWAATYDEKTGAVEGILVSSLWRLTTALDSATDDDLPRYSLHLEVDGPRV